MNLMEQETIPASEYRTPPKEIVSKGKFYLPQLDALRFLAFLAVFCHHDLLLRFNPLHITSSIQSAGGYGVSLFFALSAYLITSLLIKEKDKTGSVDLRHFYIRRVLRIWPLYFLFLGGVTLAGLWIASVHVGIARLAALSLLCGNWYFIVASTRPVILAHLWSISVEEQFYLLWPSAFRTFSRRGFLFSICVLAVTSLGLTYMLGLRGDSYLPVSLNSGAQAVYFAVGALVALLIRSDTRHSLMTSSLLITSGFGSWMVADRLMNATGGAWRFPVSYTIVAIGCAALLVGALKFPAARVPKSLIYLGKISYGLYIYHPLFLATTSVLLGQWLDRLHGSIMVVNFAATVGLASLSYQFFEMPFLRFKKRFETVKTR